MKRLLSLLCAIGLMVLLVAGCQTAAPTPTTQVPTTAPAPTEPEPPAPLEPKLGTTLSVYPLYSNLTEEEILLWDTICDAVENHSTERIPIGTYSGVSAYGNAEKRFEWFYREFAFSNPDYFWLNLYEYDLHTVETDDGKRLELELHYLMDQETAQAYKEAYDAKVDAIVSGARAQEDLFHQVLYVYDAIIETAEYDHSLIDGNNLAEVNLSAYGCLVAGKTVCSGYAMAFLTIMEKLGVECGLEFSSYQYLSTLEGHVWNYCKLEDEYYYFDLTWDDDGYGDTPTFHLFFGLNEEDMVLASRYANDNPLIPQCNGTKFNYYRYMGLNFASYDYDTVKDVLYEHRYDEAIVLRFDTSEEADLAYQDLCEGRRLFDILPNIQNYGYMIPETDLHLMMILF